MVVLSLKIQVAWARMTTLFCLVENRQKRLLMIRRFLSAMLMRQPDLAEPNEIYRTVGNIVSEFAAWGY